LITAKSGHNVNTGGGGMMVFRRNTRLSAILALTSVARIVPKAAPIVPSLGKGPTPVMSTVLIVMLSTVLKIPSFSGVFASPEA
jgi:hypothetical protein